MDKKIMWGASVLCVSAGLMLGGCGQSLFKGLDGDTKPSTALSALENGDYKAALSYANTIIDNPNATATQKIDALTVKAQALLGESGISVLTVANELKNNMKGSASLTNLADSLGKKDVYQAVAEVNRLAAFLRDLKGTSGSTLSDTTQTQLSETAGNSNLLNAMVSLSALSARLQDQVVIASDGTVTLKNTSSTYKDSVKALYDNAKAFAVSTDKATLVAKIKDGTISDADKQALSKALFGDANASVLGTYVADTALRNAIGDFVNNSAVVANGKATLNFQAGYRTFIKDLISLQVLTGTDLTRAKRVYVAVKNIDTLVGNIDGTSTAFYAATDSNLDTWTGEGEPTTTSSTKTFTNDTGIKTVLDDAFKAVKN